MDMNLTLSQLLCNCFATALASCGGTAAAPCCCSCGALPLWAAGSRGVASWQGGAQPSRNRHRPQRRRWTTGSHPSPNAWWSSRSLEPFKAFQSLSKSLLGPMGRSMVSPGSSTWTPPLRILRGRALIMFCEKTKGREEAQLPTTPEEELLHLGSQYEREAGHRYT